MKLIYALLLAGCASAQWPTGVAYPGGIDFLNAYWDAGTPPLAPITPSTKTLWTFGDGIPSACKAGLNHLCTDAQIDVYNVTYTDCTRPWVFCRCGGGVSIDDLADSFGRLPVKMRSLTRHIIANTPVGGGCGGGTAANRDLYVNGPCELNVWIHEAGHTVDHYGNLIASDFSDTTVFQNALAADSCVITPNSPGYDHEVFAQITIMFLYWKKTSTMPPATPPYTTGCWVNQFNAVNNQFGNGALSWGGTCPTRPADSNVVTRDPALRFSRVKKSVLETRELPSWGTCSQKFD